MRRIYDQAQTPMQRLLASSILSPQKQQELLRITEALDPLRLLTQLEHLQKALWRHAVTPASEPAASPAPLQFSVQQCTEEKVPIDGLPHTPPSLLKRERKKKYQKTGRPHDWRTRKDPFRGRMGTDYVLAARSSGTHRRRDLSQVGTDLPGTVSTNPATNLAKEPQQAAYSVVGNV